MDASNIMILEVRLRLDVCCDMDFRIMGPFSLWEKDRMRE